MRMAHRPPRSHQHEGSSRMNLNCNSIPESCPAELIALTYSLAVAHSSPKNTSVTQIRISRTTLKSSSTPSTPDPHLIYHTRTLLTHINFSTQHLRPLQNFHQPCQNRLNITSRPRSTSMISANKKVVTPIYQHRFDVVRMDFLIEFM